MKKYTPLISVVVLNYNGEIFLKNCIESLLMQTYKTFEILVVDNNSTDSSIKYVNQIFKKEIKNKKIRIIKLDKNYGFAGGNNLGVKKAKGEYIALLNNDTVVDKDWLRNLFSGICQDKSTGIAASKILLLNQSDLIDSAGDSIAIDGVGFKRGHFQKLINYNKDEYVFGGCGAGILYKRKLWEELKGFDKDFFAVHEDTDFNFRAQLSGYRCIFVNKAIVYHKVNSSIGKYSFNYVYWTHRNNEYTYIKNMPLKLILKYFAYHIMYNLLSFIYFSVKGKSTAFIKAKIDVIKSLPCLLKKRRIIQADRKVSIKYIESLMEKKWLKARIKK